MCLNFDPALLRARSPREIRSGGRTILRATASATRRTCVTSRKMRLPVGIPSRPGPARRGAAVLSSALYSLNAFSWPLQNGFMLCGLTCRVFESTIDSITEPVEEDEL